MFIYRYDKAVNQDGIEAIKWSQGASERDNTNLMNNIGCMHQDDNSKLAQGNNLCAMNDIKDLYCCDTKYDQIIVDTGCYRVKDTSWNKKKLRFTPTD